MKKPMLTEEDGYEALKGHAVDKALLARSRYGPIFDEPSMSKLLADPEVVRFPTVLKFDADSLMPGEFAWARALGESPSDGFALIVHPHFEGHWDVLPMLIAYHIVSINYLDVATQDEAEIFGAALFGLEVIDYYNQLCALADSIPGTALPAEVTAPATPAATSCGSGSCGCSH